MVLPPDNEYEMELVVTQQGGYSQERPHVERFFIPKQCEAFNLFQEINITKERDENGEFVSQRASFKHAMFDIDSRIEKEFGIDDFTYNENTVDVKVGGVTGNTGT